MQQRVLIFTDSIPGAGFRSVLEGVPDWSVRAASSQPPDTMAELARCYRPDVTILDAASLDIVDLFQQLGQARVALFGRVIVLTLSGINEEALFFLAKWGVAAHLSAWTPTDELVGILGKVALGEYLLTSKSLQERRLSALCPRSTRARIAVPPALPVPVASLTPREAEVLCCIARGKTNREIARALQIRETSVRKCISAIYRKLSVDNRTSAVVCALRRQWICIPEILRAQVPRAVA